MNGPRRARPIRVGRALIAVTVVGLVLFGVVTWRMFVSPPAVSGWAPGHYDAIVMYGGAGPRFERARQLAEAGAAPTLVISDPRYSGPDQEVTPYMAFCAGEHHFEAICFDPRPQTTRGESRFFAELAATRGWDRLAVVTTYDQASRARMLLGRCFDGEITVVVVPTDQNRVLRVVYEWGATARALILRRDC